MTYALWFIGMLAVILLGEMWVHGYRNRKRRNEQLAVSQEKYKGMARYQAQLEGRKNV